VNVKEENVLLRTTSKLPVMAPLVEVRAPTFPSDTSSGNVW